jgi:hypothetical protein
MAEGSTEGNSMAVDSPLAPASNVGFLSVMQEPGGYVGGYLVTNAWGRPLEFRLTSAVQANRIQQILYGAALPAYLCGELIGKTLFEKTATVARAIVTDNPMALELRRRLDIPVGLWQPGDANAAGLFVQPNLFCHMHHPDDVAVLRTFIEQLGPLDLGEPFVRIREALGEARKLGVANRLAA